MEDRTQQMPFPAPGPGVAPGATQQMSRTGLGGFGGAPGADPMRTAMGMPMRALEIEAVPGSRFGYAPGSTREHLLLLLRSSDVAVGRRMPLNLCLVIDRSGSMEGEPLEYVKRACGFVVDRLEPT